MVTEPTAVVKAAKAVAARAKESSRGDGARAKRVALGARG